MKKNKKHTSRTLPYCLLPEFQVSRDHTVFSQDFIPGGGKVTDHEPQVFFCLFLVYFYEIVAILLNNTQSVM